MSQALPQCVRCHKNNERMDGMELYIPLTQPNRIFNPDIYIIKLPNMFCKKCLMELKNSVTTWWKEGVR